MARPVSNAQVQAIANSTIDFSPYITAANLVVNDLAASDCGSSISDAMLEEIEKYLAIHFAAQANAGLAILSESVEGASVTVSRGNVQGEVGFMSTHWGQTANAISNGCLVQLQKTKPFVTFI